LRGDLFAQNVHDGFLIRSGGALSGWCQAWRRDAFAKLQTGFGFPKDEFAWMIGCLYIKPEFRKQGVAREALRLVVEALRADGAHSIDAFPKRNVAGDGDLWNGPESSFLGLGFRVVRDDPKRPVLRLTF
jgi:GNAT superfamily N-acetyltransferase